MMILRFAWRNIWRNRRRTLITVAAVSLTAGILIVTYALMAGLMTHTVANATNMTMGEAQIHHPGYLADRSMYKDIKDPGRIMAVLKDKGVPAVARSYGYGLIAHEGKSAGARFWGVDPAEERAVFALSHHLAEGRFLSDRPDKGLVLGKKLARSLGAHVGSEIVAVVQAADGSLGNDIYTVSGILKAVGQDVDPNAAIMHKDDFEALFVSQGRIHEIAINTKGRMPLVQVERIAREAAPAGEVKTWRELKPALSDMIGMFDVSFWFFGLFFFLAGGLGVMNTMLMATFERIHEFGVLKAVGTTPWRIVRDVAAEAMVLAFISTLVGLAIGLPVTYYLQKVGIDTTRFAGGNYSVGGVAFDPIWQAVISFKVVFYPIVVTCVVCLLASLYPAAIAARLDPVEAMTHV